jgi:hypothetical protein
MVIQALKELHCRLAGHRWLPLGLDARNRLCLRCMLHEYVDESSRVGEQFESEPVSDDSPDEDDSDG